ncbi:nitroreductase family protein [Paenibacillus bouchesdurhonensis]|uniref:nitroreductase family protein n=1 Tax=Paenibacillus bouchesdurhonensis TaxID=1870990 RepID=UPI000DA60D7C|nr:nitroreductase [Paenibacillus bouchesdurhonensis]
MDVMEAIHTRRSIGKVKQDKISVEIIERILEAGTWAPNHRHTEPWQFFVLRGKGREQLGQALADIMREGLEDPDSPEAQESMDKACAKAFRAPVIIAVAVTPVDRPGVIELEEYGAVFAAIQNMLLATHSLGLGAVWRTGEPCYHHIMNEAFGLRSQDKMLGFIYLGVSDMGELNGKRADFRSKTVWIGEEE